MNFLTKLSLKRPVSICLVVLSLLVFGVSAVMGMPMELMPEVNMPMLMIMTVYPGAAPEDVESLVTSRMESAASTLTGVKNIQCTSSENLSMVMLEFEYGTNMEDVKADLRGNVELQENFIPKEASKPTLIEMRSDMQPTIVLSATASADIDLFSYVDEYIKPKIKQLGGVANVDIMGGDGRYIGVTLKEEKMNQYGLSMDTVTNIIKNADFSIPAGDISQGNMDLLLRGGVSYDSPYSLNDIPLTLKTGDIIHLSDIADIGFRVPKKTSISRTNGVDDVMISVSKRQSASTFSVTEGVNKIVNEVNGKNDGISLTVLDDASKMIKISINSVLQTMLWGVGLAMLVLFIFFGDWRASLIVGTSIPLSLLVTVIAMQMAGFSLNMLSLGGLVIGIGMMVDNSIVVLESCFKNLSAKKTIQEAAIDGTAAVASSIFASTLTTVVVFLPIPFIKGMAGQLFGQLCFTIVFSLIASLISAVAIVPLVFYKLKPKEKEYGLVKRTMGNLEEGYMRLLPKTLKRKKTVLLSAVLVFVLSLVMVPLVGMELIPATDEGTITMDISTRTGLNVKRIEEIVSPAIKLVSEHPDVEKYALSIGGSGMSSVLGGSSSSCTLTAYLKSDRAMTTNEIVNLFRHETKSLLDCQVKVTATNTTSALSGGGNVDIPIQGNDYDTLVEASYIVENSMNQNPEIINVNSSVISGKPQAEIKVDPIKASAYGLLPMQVMGTVRSIMEGTEAATLNQKGRDYSVMVEYPPELYSGISDLGSMIIYNSAGKGVPLEDIAEVIYTVSPQSITKLNGQYLITLSGQPEIGASKKLAANINAEAAKLQLPQGVEIKESVQAQSMADEFGPIINAIWTAVFLVFLVMAMQFESPIFSLVVMFCVPFSLVGSFAALLISGTTISLPTLMGFLMLVGTVVNNGILFIDTTNQLRRQAGFTPEAALAKAGSMRLRPIFMTTLTTILAMVPMAIGMGENKELMRGMALVIIGGLIASTILALLLLPSFYLVFDRMERKNKEQRMLKEKAKRKIHME